GELASENIGLVGNVLLKPPILNEDDAIKDAVQTSRYIFAFREKYGLQARVLLQPYYMPLSNRIKKWYSEGYRPPYLWSILKAFV
ncbi:MAG: hypothetical protein JSV20_06055, partial [Candidatus Bathyarchaeota archaeon]